jgi:hypothetical protein
MRSFLKTVFVFVVSNSMPPPSPLYNKKYRYHMSQKPVLDFMISLPLGETLKIFQVLIKFTALGFHE